MVGTFQEILDSSSGNWVRIKSITDLRVLSFVGSSEAKYSSTELNFGRLRESVWRIVLRLSTKLAGPLAARSPGLRLELGLGLALTLEMEVERHCIADEIFQGHLIDLLAFVD